MEKKQGIKRKNKIETIENKIKTVEAQLLTEKEKKIGFTVLKDLKLSYNKLLNEVEYDKHFITNDGKRLRHLFDLAVALENMEDHIFKQHVNQFKNDFSRWVKDVFDHDPLAAKIAKLGTRKDIKESILNEINQILR